MEVRLFDAATGEPFGTPIRPSHEMKVAFSPDSGKLLTYGSDEFGGTASVWDVTGKQIGKTIQPANEMSTIRCAAFSPDGRRMVTAGYKGTAQIWDVLSTAPLGKPMQYEIGVEMIAFSQTMARDRPILRFFCKFLDAATGEPVGQSVKHDACVSAARFSPDGTKVIIVCDKCAYVRRCRTLWPGTPLPVHKH